MRARHYTYVLLTKQYPEIFNRVANKLHNFSFPQDGYTALYRFADSWDYFQVIVSRAKYCDYGQNSSSNFIQIRTYSFAKENQWSTLEDWNCHYRIKYNFARRLLISSGRNFISARWDFLSPWIISHLDDLIYRHDTISSCQDEIKFHFVKTTFAFEFCFATK